MSCDRQRVATAWGPVVCQSVVKSHTHTPPPWSESDQSVVVLGTLLILHLFGFSNHVFIFFLF